MNYMNGIDMSISTCAPEDATLSAVLDTTSMNLSEAICVMDNIYGQVFGVGTPVGVDGEKPNNMMQSAMMMRDKSEKVMNGIKELARRLGV